MPLETRMPDGQPEPPGRPAGIGPQPGGPPAALLVAASRPRRGGSTLVLDADGQNVIVVLAEDGGDATLMWAFIQRHLSGWKAVRA
jgi:hypothetical protein